MIFGQLIAKPVLTLMGTPDDVIDLAVQYLRIYLLGMPFIMLYDFGSSILRSIGDSKRPLYSLIAAGIINTGLNLLLVIVFQMSVAGVAIATVISNLTSASIVMYILMHETSVIRIDRKQLKIVPKELKKILVIGIPAGLQGMMFSIANVCIQSAINSFGAAKEFQKRVAQLQAVSEELSQVVLVVRKRQWLMLETVTIKPKKECVVLSVLLAELSQAVSAVW